MANVKRQVTEEQKEIVNNIPINNMGFVDDYEDEIGTQREIQIPDFLGKNNDVPVQLQVEEYTQAILNNTPNNTEAEEQNHLNQLENVAHNYSDQEWERLLYHAPHRLMIEEILRRMNAAEEYRKAMIDADEIMRRLKL